MIAKPEPSCPCPVCERRKCRWFMTVRNRTYFHCETCHSTWLDPSDRLPAEAEYQRYLDHQNDPMDSGYRRFLSRLADPLTEKLTKGACGLDYGCGPSPALAMMLEDQGFSVSLYDPFFHPDTSVLENTYDFITCTEVIEHFHHPATEFKRLDRLLKPGGWLGLMTCFQTEEHRFEDWHYRRDPTHVVFYREETLEQVAKQRGWLCEIPHKDVVIMEKNKRVI